MQTAENHVFVNQCVNYFLYWFAGLGADGFVFHMGYKN